MGTEIFSQKQTPSSFEPTPTLSQWSSPQHTSVDTPQPLSVQDTDMASEDTHTEATDTVASMEDTMVDSEDSHMVEATDMDSVATHTVLDTDTAMADSSKRLPSLTFDNSGSTFLSLSPSSVVMVSHLSPTKHKQTHRAALLQ